MKLPIGIVNKLLQLLQGEQLPASTLQHAVVTKMLEDGVIQKQQTGKTKALLFISNAASMHAYIKNHFGINDLQDYADKFNDAGLTRAGSVAIGSNSKLKSIRTFKGFLVNAYADINASLHGKPFIIHPVEGSYTFISDYESFEVSAAVTIVGVENPENFKYINRQQYLFQGVQPLFVSRYPQSNDLVKWLISVPNRYLHFGDFDFAGIRIYLNEYKQHLGNKASFFVPPNIEMLLDNYGNRDLYNKQQQHTNNPLPEPELLRLTALLDKYKKGLEQEILIKEIPTGDCTTP
ncbi:MAG: hypothetical protein JWQ40_1368 [Segetibacter sp.]|nr:hypothetical protein [Segetibacter sp.]